MHRIRVGVLRGGPSSEYDISLKTGATVLNNLSQDKYHARDIFIDKEGQWHMHGLPVLPHSALNHLDVVFNALHGHYGEDGKVQHILESHKIPFTGSRSYASVLGMNKIFSKEIFRKEKIKTPDSVIVSSLKNIKEKVLEIFHKFPLPAVVKPVTGGSSIGVSIVKTFDSLEEAIKCAMQYSDKVIIEEYIMGREASCGVIEDFRDKEFYSLPPIEIKSNNKFFDYDAKYNGASTEVILGNFTDRQKSEIERMAIEAHQSLGLMHYSRSDFIIHPTRGIFILETNTLPGLTKESLLPQSLEVVGATMPQFLEHIIGLALSRK